jgi:homoserine O-acetyltransferase/O-succinyltransferase
VSSSSPPSHDNEQSDGVELVYQTYGRLNNDISNVILYPTSYGAQHSDIDWLISDFTETQDKGILDASQYFIIIPNMFGNGMSLSPSTNPTLYKSNPEFFTTQYDNVRAQKLLLDHLEIDQLAMIYGWSMGAQQGYHFAALYPDMVERLVAICGTAKTTDHNKIFLWSLQSALQSDPNWNGSSFDSFPDDGIRTFALIYASWAASQPYYNRNFGTATRNDSKIYEQLGYTSLKDYLQRGWEDNYRRRDPHNFLAMVETWLRCDVSSNPVYEGDYHRALQSITARTIVMPSTTDLYFTPEDCYHESELIPNSEFLPIESIWGHRAGNPYQNPDDETFIRNAVRRLLQDEN